MTEETPQQPDVPADRPGEEGDTRRPDQAEPRGNPEPDREAVDKGQEQFDRVSGN